MLKFIKKLFNIKDKINYANYRGNGLHKCPKCKGSMLILSLETAYNSYMRPINTSWCTECGYEIDHVTEWEKEHGYEKT